MIPLSIAIFIQLVVTALIIAAVSADQSLDSQEVGGNAFLSLTEVFKVFGTAAMLAVMLM